MVLTTSTYAMMALNFQPGGGSLVPHTPSIMASLVEEDMVWTCLFILVCVAATLANIIFLLYGSANLQHWNTLTESREKLNTEGEFLHNNLIIDFHKQHKQCDHDLI